MKKILKTFAYVSLLLSAAFSITANADYGRDSVTVSINDKIVEFDIPPIIEDGRTLVPIRAISEQIDYDVVWDGANMRVEIKNNGDTLELFIGKRQYLKNGIEKQMDVPPTLTNGRTLVPLRLVAEELGCTVRWLQETRTAEIVKYETVKVSNAKELLKAIGSRKRIILSEGEYNLSKVDEKTANGFIAETDYADGTEYSVIAAKDLIIEGEKGKIVNVIVEPRNANVLSFAKCEHVLLKNITMGHSIAQGDCTGGVLSFGWCDSVNMENLRLYGCGTVGISAEQCANVSVKNTEIYECSYGLVDMTYSQKIAFDNCVFRDTRGFDMFYFYNCSNVKVSNSVIKNNNSGAYATLVAAYNSVDVLFENCNFNANVYREFSTEDVDYKNCKNNNRIMENNITK